VSNCCAAAAEQLKKDELLRLRHEARHDRKAHAMASRTKDNLQVFPDDEDKTNTSSSETQDDPVVDLKHLFTKHDRRVPHLPSEKIPDMLSAMKDRQKQRRLEQEKAKKAAEAAEDARIRQQKLHVETSEPDHKRKKLCIPPPSSVSIPDRKHHSPPESVSVLPKSVSAGKDVESKVRVKKKTHPPPLNFEQLMALAQQKQAEPVVNTQPCSVPQKKVSVEQQRPMTQEEKDRQKRRETKEYQDWLKYGGPAPPAPSGGKSRHQQRARESCQGQKTVSANVTANDAFDVSDSDSETEHTGILHKVNGMRSYPHSTMSKLKDDTDTVHMQLSATKAESSQRLVEPSRPVSHGEVLFTKGKVMTSAKVGDADQNGKSKSLSDELIEKLKEERRKMVENGDAVPSLADMLQDLLNKVRGETNLQATASKQPLPSGTSSKPSSSSTKSKKIISEGKAESLTARPQSAVASSASRSSQYATVNETVVYCARDKLNSAKHGDKRPMKSTWEEMYHRSKSKNPNRDDRGTVFCTTFFLHSSFLCACHFCVISSIAQNVRCHYLVAEFREVLGVKYFTLVEM